MMPSSPEFVFVTDIYENQTRMRSNCRVQASILRVMHDNDDSFCDVKLFGVPPTGIQADCLRPIRAHKSVLSCASKNLRDLLTSEDYTDSNLSEYHIENIEHENLRRIVEFIYTDQLMMSTEDTVDEMCRVLTGAKYLVMKNVADACETFLAGDAQIKLENCIKLWFFARKYSCLTLLHATSTFIASNLASARGDTEFLRMPFEDCAKLLLCEAMIAANTDERCLAAIAWLTHDTVGRASFVIDVLNMIPLSPDTISVKTIYVVHECKMLREYASDTVQKLTGGLLHQLSSAVICPIGGPGLFNKCVTSGDSGHTDLLHWYVVGGEHTERSFVKYDVQHRTWSRLSDLPWDRYACGTCAIANRLVIMGGSKNGRVTNNIDEYDLSTHSWKASGVQLSCARKSMGSCSDGLRNAYAISGEDAEGMERCVVERYNCKSKQVEIVAACVPRSGFVAALSNNRIFAAGGNTKDVRVYDISADQWSIAGYITPAKCCRLGGVISADEFYLAGGMMGGEAVDKVEIFNIRSGQIRTGCRLKQARYDCGMTTLNNGNVVCVVGGVGVSGRSLNSVECLDKREGKWSMGYIVPNMPTRASGFGFVAI